LCCLPTGDERENTIPMLFLCFMHLTLCGILGMLLWPNATLAANATAGEAVYQQYCSVCHGAQGKGNGPAATAMQPKPRDHTNGTYMNRFSDTHLRKVIGEGGAAVGRSPLMPSWNATLTPEQIGDVIAYLRTLAIPAYQP
jgi:cytochrome c oxidase cbb3-type subunit 3